MAQEERAKWQIHIARAESLGGRALRRQLDRAGSTYRIFEEEPYPGERAEEEQAGLLLPFLEIDQENQAAFLPKVALSLQQARPFDRTVLLLAAPLPGVLALVERHLRQGLQVTAVCAGQGELYGGERPEDPAGPVEELLDALLARLGSASPRKRVILPYGEREKLTLTYIEDMASAALYILRRDKDTSPLLVQGDSFAYGELARLAAQGTGFGGKLQFSRGKLPKQQASREGFRGMSSDSPYHPQLVLSYLAKVRAICQED